MALLGLLLLVGGTWVPQAAGLRILVVHPLYAGSHVLTLQVRQSVVTMETFHSYFFSVRDSRAAEARPFCDNSEVPGHESTTSTN